MHLDHSYRVLRAKSTTDEVVPFALIFKGTVRNIFDFLVFLHKFTQKSKYLLRSIRLLRIKQLKISLFHITLKFKRVLTILISARS